MESESMRQPEYLDTLCSTADGVFLVDSSQRIIRWNKGAEGILGFTDADVVDRHCFEVIAGRNRANKAHCRSGCHVQECLANRDLVENFDVMTRTKTGGNIWLNVSVIAVNGGDPIAAHVVRDVTRDRHRGEAIEQFLATLGIYGTPRDRHGERARRVVSKHPQQPETPATLSRREIEVLTLIAEGLSTKAVAQRLKISHYTARNHIQNILAKLELHSKAQVVAYAFRKGLL
jgi:PAS domain S-box-containing protein